MRSLYTIVDMQAMNKESDPKNLAQRYLILNVVFQKHILVGDFEFVVR